MTFFFAGMDTTGFTTTMCFYALAAHPNYYDKVLEEIKRIIPDLDKFTFEDLNRLEFLGVFVKEVLRCWPTLANLIPRLPLKKIKIGDFELD